MKIEKKRKLSRKFQHAIGTTVQIELTRKEAEYLEVILARYCDGHGASNIQLNGDAKGNGFPAELHAAVKAVNR